MIFPAVMAVVGFMTGFASCSGGGPSAKAEQLYAEADGLRQKGEYESALALLDSIDRTYASAVDVRRKVLVLRPVLIEQVTNRQLEIADSMAAEGAYRLDSMSRLLQRVSNPIEDYFVAKAEGGRDVSVPGLHGRMAPDGRFYMVASSPHHISTTSFSLSSGGESVQAPAVSFDGERNDRSGATDVITYVEGESQEVGEFIVLHRNDPVTITFQGSRAASMTLPETQRKGMATLFEVATLIRERKKQELEKQRLERILQTVRTQIARTAVADTIP